MLKLFDKSFIHCQDTKRTATHYGLVGWVKNTDTGTVTGVVQGPQEKIIKMLVTTCI